MTAKPSFDEILQSSSLPSPGPEYYEARRRLWLTPKGPPRPPSQPSSSRRRLEDLFNQPGAVHSQEVWSSGLEKVWRGLSSGGRPKSNLPLPIVIKIIHAAWLRDRTWPPGMEAPDSDDEQPAQGSATPQTSLGTPDTSLPGQHNPSAAMYGRSDLMEPAPPWITMQRA